MNFLSKFFHLEGHGYLENVSYRGSKCIADIKVIHQLQEEDIALECEAQGILEEYLLNLMQAVKKGKSMIVSFQAVYGQFKTVFHCANPEGKYNGEKIVVIGCKLFSIRNCYVDGSWVEKHFPYLAAA